MGGRRSLGLRLNSAEAEAKALLCLAELGNNFLLNLIRNFDVGYKYSQSGHRERGPCSLMWASRVRKIVRPSLDTNISLSRYIGTIKN